MHPEDDDQRLLNPHLDLYAIKNKNTHRIGPANSRRRMLDIRWSRLPAYIVLLSLIFIGHHVSATISQSSPPKTTIVNSGLSGEKPSDAKVPDAEDASAKGYQMLLGADKDAVSKIPHFAKAYGQLGVNYDLDRGQPFIWCEQVNTSCVGTPDQCVRNVKCYPERRSHRLGCMAVFVYNITDTELRNHTIPPGASTLKGCWSHYETELRECMHESECISHTRKTGAVGRSAKFCCCRTHYCNQNMTFYTPEDNGDHEVATTTPSFEFSDDFHLIPRFLVGSTIIALMAAFLFVACVGATSALSFWFVRKKKRGVGAIRLKDLENADPFASACMEVTSECEALLGEKVANLRYANLRELLSTGHFSEIYRAEVDEISVAVRVYHSADSDGWVNEQEIYAIKALRTHENIVDFLASLRQPQNQYWFICKYYYNGSVFDYLERNLLQVQESCKILYTMLNGLAFLHEEFYLDGELKPSVVHRDFKSKNVLLKPDLTACIGDFGYAVKCENGRMANEDNQSQIGTRRYMSPEVLEGATEFSGFAFQQIDVYAASLVVWEVLSRTRVPEEPNEIIPEYMLPYEREIGKSPTLGRLRELVVMRKFRPLFRETLFENIILEKIMRTTKDMWDSEPDGRITSSCARDRMAHYFEVCLGKCDLNDHPSSIRSHDAASMSSTNSSLQTGSATTASFDCPSATGTTLPIAGTATNNGSASSQEHFSSRSSIGDEMA